RETGFKVKVLKSGDAGKALSQALLVKDRPVADALFGVDNTFLSRALDNGLFAEYTAKGIENVPVRFRLDPKHRVTPIDSGDVCVNDDLAWFGHDGRPPAPKSLADLAQPAYRKLLVVENPASSSPGLAFVLSTIAAFGENGWRNYWQELRKNGVRVDDGWEQAYDSDFTAASRSGDRPLVVSYATDPAADVVFSNGKKRTPTVGVVPGTCFGQIEFAGVLENAKNPTGARALIDFMLTRRFQEDIPLQMYVYPVLPSAKLPPVFTKYAVQPAHPFTLSASAIGKHRNEWIDEWTRIVLQ
ncbi:MAG: thiamine transport system substrate-binding protein, partial [Actinomycetota bacterium]|nr:thiamine transport system substrate-binding protein [Actinomycetota bacterium]